MIKFAKIRKFDISNGDGIRCSLFTQGCNRHCKNCFNKETWDFEGGSYLTKDIEDGFVELCKEEYISGISILGGEPFQQATQDMYDLLKRLKEEVGKPVWIWTGYTFEEIKTSPILNYVDVLIDGEFDEMKKNLRLKYKGSTNQRVIDVQESIKQNAVILYEK